MATLFQAWGANYLEIIKIVEHFYNPVVGNIFQSICDATEILGGNFSPKGKTASFLHQNIPSGQQSGCTGIFRHPLQMSTLASWPQESLCRLFYRHIQ
jgi:hypothetical protein